MKNKNNEIWVFLSHSHEDYEKVRKVRDVLEDWHMRPLMFFLKCLNDHDEIDSLIKREIDCRTRFILCDSKNARKSKWVQKEVEYIRAKDRICETIDLSLPIEEIKKKLNEFKRKATLFLSYCREETSLATSIYERLSKYDFQLFFDVKTLQSGCSFVEQITHSLEKAVEDGYIIAILNEHVLAQGWQRREIVRAIKSDQTLKRMSVLPFVTDHDIIENLNKDKELRYLQNYSIQDISDKTLGVQCDTIVNVVLKRLLTPGAILAHAQNFSEDTNRKVDKTEVNKLFGLYFELVIQAIDNGSETAWRALGECYEMGWGTYVDFEKALECYQHYRNDFGYKEDVERIIVKMYGGRNSQ